MHTVLWHNELTFTVSSQTDHQQMTRDHCQQFVFSSDADPATDESDSLVLAFAGVGDVGWRSVFLL